MATSLTINGVAYSFPQTGDSLWGDNVTNWATAVTNGMLQKAGGTFTLTADVNFGSSFGLLAKYFTSVTSNAASAGAVRLAVTDLIKFRNNANSADLSLGVNASDQLTFESATLISTTGTIAASKAVVTNGSSSLITHATTTATEVGYLTGVSSAIQTQLNGKQATGNYITALTGNVTASGPGSVAATIAAGAVTTSMLAAGVANGLTGVTAATNDYVVIADTSDSGNVKKALVSDFASPRSEVYVDTGNGHGGTATKIRRFTNTRRSNGTAITYADSAANGGTFTINEDGIYAIDYSDYKSSGTVFIAATIDVSSGTTNASSLTYANGRRLGVNTAAAGLAGTASWTGFIASGSVVRAQTDGAADSADAFCAFSIMQVSK